MKRALSIVEEQEDTKRFRGASNAITTYQEILAALDEVDLAPSELAILSRKIEALYTLKANKIVQHFPTDLWNFIFKSAELQKTPLSRLLEVRGVCQSWNKIICSFPKIQIPEKPAISKMLQIFSLKSLDLTVWLSDVSILTGLRHLKLTSHTGRTLWSDDMREFESLTNLTKLTLASNHITSLGPLTSLQCLSLKCPAIKQPEVMKISSLTRLVSNTTAFFREGRGIYKTSMKSSYEGDWKDGLAHGRGTTIFGPQSLYGRYDGEYKNNKFDGMGTMVWKAGGHYEGQWKEGYRCGYGVRVLHDGERYEGEWKDNRANGKGVRLFPDGERYEGEFKDDMKDGYGVWSGPGPRGGRHEGEWKQDKAHGHGVIIYPDGSRYEGEFKDDRRSGVGVHTSPDGTRYNSVTYNRV